jgi:predicted aspartyl protease
MQTAIFTEADTERAMAIWAEYQKTHDLSGYYGQAAGVDPHTGEVFIGGRTAGDIIDRLLAEGRWRPLVFWRVGFPYYGRIRGVRRWSPAPSRRRAAATGPPVVPIEIAGQTFEAIVDTGFEGSLQLPDVLLPLVHAVRRGQQPYQYGDGRIGFAPLYDVTVRFDDEDRVMRTQFEPSDEVILGVDALKDYRLEVNFVAGTVVLDRVAP